MAASAGYSGTPLARKLGLKEAQMLLTWNAPDQFEEWLAPLPSGASVVRVTPAGKSRGDVAVVFAPDVATLKRCFPKAKARLTQEGGLWISWPKKSSGVETDLTESIVRDLGLASGMVDNKVCAISDVWSGLRFVVRVSDRIPAKTKAR